MPPKPLILPEVHGHRGCRGLRPENTLAGFLYALELGVDALELDVVISADEQVVVSHEPWLSAAICRDAAGERIDPASERLHNLFLMPYAAIRPCDCGSVRNPRFPHQLLNAAYKPLLQEVIAEANRYAQYLGRPLPFFSIEIKSSLAGDGILHPSPPRFVELVSAVVHAADVAKRTTLLSFDKRVLQAARNQVPYLPLCLLVEDAHPLADHLRELGFVPAVYGPEHRLVDEKLVAKAHTHGMRIIPWTVNEPADMQRLLTLGVDGITTDYPDLLVGLLLR
ncbi:glycerophosphodiester phosphodiesterase [Hymenobacter sp. BT188]|uniref:glycerophosphodiester phosphodiesterase family protein n=1 Tax=Hymenobacter sp. BT188 TaxID=2763504 RepID=UPI0016512298|nr:glycerophosphodiester phosphodiesterase family protein [Hymenobacter sp. BT188]MBC6608273.1 glycerophosphodiester phosphodiesterase [Hymenobacter sp. BT188]